MSEENKTTINYIFYLQTKPELDSNYYMMAEIFSKINISLLPIMPEDLRSIEKAKKYHLVVMRNDLSSAFTFNQLKKDYLDAAMGLGKIGLFDISSFSEIENANKFKTKNMYRYFGLPQNLKQVAMTIAVDYFRDRNTEAAEWPGGKRAKLPTMTNQ